MKIIDRIMISIMSISAIFLIIIGGKYINTMSNAQSHFRSYEIKSCTINTSLGQVSYIDEGRGPVILSCHGLCGGYDQAYDTLCDKTDKYRILAPSRFGYPGSDMPKNHSIDSQVQAFSEMLDQLNIKKVYVLGTSAGGATAIKFALTHPERTKGLILFCSMFPPMEAPKIKSPIINLHAPTFSDFPIWLMGPILKPFLGINDDSLQSIMPLSYRYDGIACDLNVSINDMKNNYNQYDLTTLKVPTLIIHAKDDKLTDYNSAAFWARKIPNCTFISLKDGGHIAAGNSKETNEALYEFIKKHLSR